jgi:hypothetical protein
MPYEMAVMKDLDYDVIVVGGGPAGIGAALAAQRMGLRTVVIERHPYLGGMGTAALVNNFCNAHKENLKRPIIGGVFGELRRRLIEARAIFMTDGGWMEPYDPEAFIGEVSAMFQDAGVTCMHGRSVRAVDFSAAGEARLDLDDGTRLCGHAVVDATGDGVVAKMADVPYTFGRSDDKAVMPLTYCYSIGPIDIEKVRREMPFAIRHDSVANCDFIFVEEHPTVIEWIQKARTRGELTIPRKHIVSITSIPNNIEYATVNFGRVFCDDPTDPAKLAKAELEGRKQVDEGIQFYRKYLPGFENVQLKDLARQIGVRESRQIIGLYTLTGEDVVSGRQFEDVIAQCCYPVDIHEPNCDGTTLKAVRGPGHYDIPWRCLVPKSGPSNLIVAGRCISATHEAMSSFRVTPSVMAIGEAAGVTASIAVQKNCPMANVPVLEVQQRLLATGGILK